MATESEPRRPAQAHSPWALWGTPCPARWDAICLRRTNGLPWCDVTGVATETSFLGGPFLVIILCPRPFGETRAAGF